MSSSSSSEIGDMSAEKPASWTAVETGPEADKLMKQGKKEYEKIVKKRKKAADKVIKKRKKSEKKAEKKAAKDSLAQQELNMEAHVKRNVGNMRSISVKRASSLSPLKIMDPNKERPEDKPGYDNPFANIDTKGEKYINVKSAKSPKSRKTKKKRKKRKSRKKRKTKKKRKKTKKR
jgi:hypothetical protein